ncbi:MAG TPA: RHS repeat-associated core domain-containing protein, partial [Terracidiphilus sp.]|nr:RHS repeat-associated core domain-containing protein [Terracidiphilus sp.]
DRYGNRLSQTVTAGSGPSSNLSFSSNNQPTGYTFDSSGNMTVEPFSPPNNMTYDGENRMTAFSGNGGAATYTYDGNGLRVVKSVQGGTTTVSIRAGSSVIAEYDNGAVPTSPSREYIYNPAGGATTGLLAMISGAATTYYHQDHLSVRLTTNSSGSILTQEGTFPFGEAWYQSGATNEWVFTSYQRDSESGLDYALARYYDSRTGTFCSADPLAGDPSDPQSWNRYPYGRNDPVDVTDPSGKSWLTNFFQGLAVATGGPVAAALFIGEDLISDGMGFRNGPPSPVGSFGGMSVGTSWNGTPIYMPNPGLAGALGFPTMADVGGPIQNVQDAATPSDGTTNCFGWATIRGVGGRQARAKGAFYSAYPKQAGGSIRGGTFGTVAVQEGFLGLSARQFRTYGTQISIRPAFSDASSTQFGGPPGPWTVSDNGNADIQATKGVAFDLYRFPTVKLGNQFGKQIMPVIINFPNASGGHCPPGYTVAK